MTCPQTSASLDICPTADEIVPQLIALLPRGRAWGTHDGGPQPASTSYRFWYAVATVWEWVNQRICDLKAEFFCSSQSETHGDWLEEYGLPDGCDPFPDLCAKVAAVGGARCDYYIAICARAGWTIDCASVMTGCGARAGRARAGRAVAGRGIPAGVLVIRVHLGASPAYTGILPPDPSAAIALRPVRLAGRFRAGQALACPPGSAAAPPLAGRFRAGRRLGCPPDITGLVCLIERIAGAHMTIRYEVLP